MSQLSKLLKALSIEASCEAKLIGFVSVFEKWNEKINLSASRSREDLLGHVRDSLHVVPLLRDRPSVLDVGSGGGFPVVVAAICLPSASFIALEPIHKKQAFLRTVARELGLSNLDAHAERIEDHPGCDYDAAMSRATMDVRDWLVLARTHVRIGGLAIGFEGQQRDDLPAGTRRESYALDGKQRALVVLEHTPAP